MIHSKMQKKKLKNECKIFKMITVNNKIHEKKLGDKFHEMLKIG